MFEDIFNVNNDLLYLSGPGDAFKTLLRFNFIEYDGDIKVVMK
jgi:hypothetical protein